MDKSTLILGIFFFIGCGRSPISVSPSTVPLQQGMFKIRGPVSGESCAVYLFGIVPVGALNNTQTAISDAISKEPGAKALVNVTIDSSWKFLFLFSKVCTHVEGLAVSLKSNDDSTNSPCAKYTNLTIDKNQIKTVMHDIDSRAQECAKANGFSEKTKARISLNCDGTVEAVNVLVETANRSFGTCLEDVIKGLRFPGFKNPAGASFIYPFNFADSQPEPASE